jgi:alpha-glucosidase
VLAFRRSAESGNMLCVFNLSRQVVTATIAGLADGIEPEAVSERASLKGRKLTLGPNGFAFIAEPTGVESRVTFTRRSLKPA